jgi:FkbM family methyltransferase
LIRLVGRHQNVPIVRRFGNGMRAIMSVDGLIVHGEGAGLRFNSQGGNAGYALGTSELEIQRVFGRLLAEGQVVYDVGAASGFYTVIAARAVGESGRVIAFEPRPENVERVRHNVALNGFGHVEILELALADSTGSASFSLGAEVTRGGLSQHHAEPAEHGTIEVQISTVDHLVSEGLPPPDVIKMDIEGAEVEALAGAASTLATRAPTLLIEVHGRAAELDAVLRRIRYVGKVIEADVPVSDAIWGMHVLATPSSSFRDTSPAGPSSGSHSG